MVTIMLKSRTLNHGHCGGSSISIANLANGGGDCGGREDGDSDNNNNNNNPNGRLGPIINSFSLAGFRPAKHFNRAQAMRSLRSVAFRSFRPFRYRK